MKNAKVSRKQQLCRTEEENCFVNIKHSLRIGYEIPNDFFISTKVSNSGAMKKNF